MPRHGWFALDQLPQPLSLITRCNLRDYRRKLGLD